MGESTNPNQTDSRRRMEMRRYLMLLPCCLGLAGCASTPTASRLPAPAGPSSPAVGYASYYGRQYDGRKTASGEVYHMHQMTAAHRTLPFDTQVRVTLLANNRSVIVRVNDRGPFSRDRIIDVSFEAARKLGLLATGTARVRVEVVGKTVSAVDADLEYARQERPGQVRIDTSGWLREEFVTR